MRFMSLWILAPVSALLLAATPTPLPAGDVSAPTITRLMLRDYEIVISSGVDGATRYDVYSQMGESLGSDLTEMQLQAAYPTIYNQLQPAVAGEATGPTMMMRWNGPMNMQ
ncbi:MAG: hypothetical protein AAFQ63_16765 [Cyanobacteria bacterium J06621_11]